MSTKTIQIMTNGEVVPLTSKDQFAKIEALITDPNAVVRGEWIEGTQLPPKKENSPDSEDVLIALRDPHVPYTVGYYNYHMRMWATDYGHYTQDQIAYWQYIKPIPEVKE